MRRFVIHIRVCNKQKRTASAEQIWNHFCSGSGADKICTMYISAQDPEQTKFAQCIFLLRLEFEADKFVYCIFLLRLDLVQTKLSYILPRVWSGEDKICIANTFVHRFDPVCVIRGVNLCQEYAVQYSAWGCQISISSNTGLPMPILKSRPTYCMPIL